MTGSTEASVGTSGDILLIAPLSFYSFAKALKSDLEGDGRTVTLANDEYPANFVGKIMGKMSLYKILSWLTKLHFRKNFLNGKIYDLCIVIKGRGLRAPLISDLKQASKRIVGYNFDSFAFNSSPLAWCKLVSKYATFDFDDASRHSLPRVDLFSFSKPIDADKKVTFEISAILRNHSERLGFVDKTLNAIGSNSVFIYIYELNYITFFINFIKNPYLYIKYWRFIHFKSLPGAEYDRVLRESSFTIDFAHPKQSGITMRCFEAAAARTKIITNNRHVLKHPFFDQENVVVFDRGSAALRAEVTKIREATPPARHRSSHEFLQDLLSDPSASTLQWLDR